MRKRRIHYYPQTVEAEERGIICLRGKNRDPRDCDGADCPTDIYALCIKMLQTRQEERINHPEKKYKKSPETLTCNECQHFDTHIKRFDKYDCPKRNEVHRSATWANHCSDFKRRKRKKRL